MGNLVVIPTLDEAAHLDRVLAELRAGSTGPMRVVVVDGGSADATRDIAARSQGVEVLHNPKRLQAAAVNLAVRQARPDEDVVVRVDAHCSYPPGFVDAVSGALRARRREGCASVVVPMRTVGTGVRQHAIAATQNSVLGNGGSLHRRGGSSRWVDHGHHAAMAVADLLAVGGYDETMPANEDAELDARLTAAGHRIWFAGDVPIDYFPRSTFAALARQYHRYGQGRARTTVLHRRLPKPRQLAPVVVTLANGAALLAARRHPAALAVPATYLAGVSAVAAAEAVRERDPGLALMVPAVVVQHHAWGAGYLRALAAGLLSRARARTGA